MSDKCPKSRYTHLQCENERLNALRNKHYEDIGKLMTERNAGRAEIIQQAATIERLQAENSQLREALESLLDEQNGPPLIRHAASWQAAVDRAMAILGSS